MHLLYNIIVRECIFFILYEERIVADWKTYLNAFDV